eukprot:TRINITY_DN14924_c0_g1_i1.p1 TRINITY_DN14924_c0_g1~~TRINITY_DN14924_c0_g1_i1.p1  ORF type:complete len:375 (-),score=40.99 TRINITY_DN14924_c0_g1_i1:70-1194(-)
MSDIGDFTSWRQVGRSTGGALKRPPKSNSERRTQSSIPTKFEVTLKDNTAKKAFGSTSSRFSHYGNELPGPGTYVAQSSLENSKPSIGKKGLGNGFVSKTRRGQFGPRRQGPGPGAYDVTKTTGIGYSVAKAKTGGGGSAFGRDTGAQRDNMRKVDPEKIVPGPGAYGVPDVKAIGQRKGPSAAFKRAVGKSLRPEKTTVGPGSYEVVDTQGGGRFNWQADRKKGSAVFRSSTARDSLGKGPSKRASIGRAVLDPIVGNGQSDPPGPGYYAVDGNTIGKKKYIERPAKPQPYTSIRAVPVKEKKVEVTPGPGSYDTHVSKGEIGGKKSVSSSMFLSSSSRAPLEQKAGPGPAFYKPAGGQKKSFLLNQTGKWVG